MAVAPATAAAPGALPAFLPPALLGAQGVGRRPLRSVSPARRPRAPHHLRRPPARARLAQSDGDVRALLDPASVAITGGTGLLGRAAVRALCATRARVTVLAREPGRARQTFAAQGGRVRVVRYDAAAGTLSPDAVRAVRAADAVLNLAGEPVDDGRWTPARKDVLRKSRVTGTRALARAMRGSRARLVSASAVGFYGASADGRFEESGAQGKDFLAQLAGEWEAAAAQRGPESVVVLRLGVVLSRAGGAAPKMATAFRAFLGGPPGDGRQWMSWVHVDDVVRFLLRAAVCDGVSGVYNVTAPRPVRLAEFCRELGRSLRRPSWLPVPAAAVRAALGTEAAQLILAGQRVVPARAIADGFVFRYQRVSVALDELFLQDAEKEVAGKSALDTRAAK